MKKQGALHLAAMIPSAMLCAACGTDRIEIVKPPVELTQCADEPLAPDLPPRELQSLRDQMTLAYILALRGAWGDCKSKVAGVRAWADGLGD